MSIIPSGISQFLKSSPSGGGGFSKALGWAGLGLGAVSGVANLVSQNKTNKENMRFQSQENEKNRNFAAQQADLAYNRQVAQWMAENKYNSPVEQKKRLLDAGLNPDLMYGGGVGSMSGATLPAVSQAQSAGSGSPSSRALDYGNVLNNSLLSAQIGLIKSETEKNRADTVRLGHESDILASDARYREQLNSGNLQLQSLDILIKGKIPNLTDAQINQCKETTRQLKLANDNFNVTLDEVRARTSNYTASALKNYVDAKLAGPLANAQISHFAASAKLSYAQAREIITLLVYKKLNLEADTRSKNASAAVDELKSIGIDIQNERDEIQLTIDQLLAGDERVVNMYSSLTSATKAMFAGDYQTEVHNTDVGRTAKDRYKLRKRSKGME